MTARRSRCTGDRNPRCDRVSDRQDDQSSATWPASGRHLVRACPVRICARQRGGLGGVLARHARPQITAAEPRRPPRDRGGDAPAARSVAADHDRASITNVFAHGFPLFNLWHFPKFGGDEFMRSVNAWHGLLANIIITVALFHSAAALFHHHVIKDGVLRRMWSTLTER
jgi:hypothetical protein